MTEPLDTIERDGFVAKIHYDEDAESPESWTTVGTLAYRIRGAGHNAHTLPHPDYEMTRDAAPDHVVILPVRAWDDRAGTELRVADSWEEANGWIYATAESIAETVGTTATGDEVREALAGELAEWQKWAQGDVYGVVVEDEHGEQVDACWGFYGDEYAEQEAERMLSEAIEAANESAFERLVAAGCEAGPTHEGVAVTTPDGDTFGPFPDYSSALRHPSLRLASSTDDEREADRRLGADIRAMYEEWMSDADEDGILPGSAADQCADLYQVLTRNGLVVR